MAIIHKKVYHEYDFPKHLIIRAENGFYRAYSKSALILGSLMGYNLAEDQYNRPVTGNSNLELITRVLKSENFSYVVLEKNRIIEKYDGQNPFQYMERTGEPLKPSPLAVPDILRNSKVCALIGSKTGQYPDEDIIARQDAEIDRAVEDGYLIFVTSVYCGYELYGIHHIFSLRENDSRLKLAVVQPIISIRGRNWRNVQTADEIMLKADYTETIQTVSSQAQDQINNWLIDHSGRVIYTADITEADKRMKENMTPGKELVFVGKIPKPVPQIIPKKKPKPSYPENLLKDMFAPVFNVKMSDFPEDVSERLSTVLNQMTEKQRKFVTMRYMEGKTYQEIGDIFHSSKQSVQQHVKHTLQKIREDDFYMSYITGKRNTC